MKKVELLAPARNIKAIKAALNYADSVYFGVESFNMRMRTENIPLKDLKKVVSFCHQNNLKAYLTTNILVYDNELKDLRNVLEKAKEAEIDAVIIHDIAALQIARELGLDFHMSTQCNISNSLSARFYENLGAKRLILARELSLEKIKEIKRNLVKTEVEIFIHGAMCTSVSGRCYFSQDICGTPEKSANRGKCIQPCRRRWWLREESGTEYIYDGVRFLNSRDLCTIAYIPQFIEAKIDAFKIEGRMRHPHYVEVVSKIYREAIEAYYDNSYSKKKVRYWVKELKKVYNRGFTPGFYFKRMTEEDHQHKSPANLSHNGKIVKNDDIIIMGPKTDTYLHFKANKLFYNGKLVKETPRGTKKNNVLIEMEVNGRVLG
ncbi:MAG: peptidase U32 family protein, partial [Promethearchaeota archaeon]